MEDILGPVDYSKISSKLGPERSNPEKAIDAQTISAGSTQDINLSSLEGYSAAVVIVKATYNASATSGVRVRWLYSPDGTNYDSEADAEARSQYYDMSFAAGTTRQATVLIPIFAPYIKVQIVNLDSSYSVEVTVWKLLLR